MLQYHTTFIFIRCIVIYIHIFVCDSNNYSIHNIGGKQVQNMFLSAMINELLLYFDFFFFEVFIPLVV